MEFFLLIYYLFILYLYDVFRLTQVPPPTFADDQATLVSRDGVGHFL